MENSIKKILLVDDHSVVRQGLSLLIKNILTKVEIFHADQVKSAIELIKTTSVDYIFLDVNFPDQNTSFSTIELIKQILPNVKIAIFSSVDEEIHASRFIKIGADAFINKLSSDEQLLFSLEYFIKNGKYIGESVKSKLIDSYLNKTPDNPISQLSDKELEVAQLMVKGLSNANISDALNLKKSTVSTYKKRVYEKLDIDNIADLFEIFSINS